MENEKLKSITKILMILSGLTLLAYPAALIVSVMMFDSPGSEYNMGARIFSYALQFYPIPFIVFIIISAILSRRGNYKWSNIFASIPLMVVFLLGLFLVGAILSDIFKSPAQKEKGQLEARISRYQGMMRDNRDIFWNGSDRFIIIDRVKDSRTLGKIGRTVELTHSNGGNDPNMYFGKITSDSKIVFPGYDSTNSFIKMTGYADFQGMYVNDLKKFKNTQGKYLLDIYPFDPSGSTSEKEWSESKWGYK